MADEEAVANSAEVAVEDEDLAEIAVVAAAAEEEDLKSSAAVVEEVVVVAAASVEAGAEVVVEEEAVAEDEDAGSFKSNSFTFVIDFLLQLIALPKIYFMFYSYNSLCFFA